jgi:hypothetical protein
MVTAPMWTSRPSNTQVWGGEEQSGGAALADPDARMPTTAAAAKSPFTIFLLISR